MASSTRQLAHSTRPVGQGLFEAETLQEKLQAQNGSAFQAIHPTSMVYLPPGRWWVELNVVFVSIKASKLKAG